MIQSFHDVVHTRQLRMGTGLAIGLLVGATGTSGPAPLEAQTAGSGSGVVDLEWGVKIPTRAGPSLNATLYKPGDLSRPVPVIFTFTPYQSDRYHARGMYFARNGYVFALVDVRGRGNSEGSFEPFRNEGVDGHDAVEWFASQPWSDGQVTMWGGSYAGYDQWTVLKEFPPHLSTIVPAASGYFSLDFPGRNNIISSYAIQWLTLTSGVMAQFSLFGDGSFWNEKYTEMYTQHLPFRSLDELVGNPSEAFQSWMDHPHPDDWWDALAPTSADYARIDVPILTITGHYDGDQPGALEYYRRHMAHGTPEGRAQHYLVIGPWDHAGTRTPTASFGGLRFDDTSLVDLNRLHKEWYDWTMKDGPRPPFLEKRVAYFVTGAGEWRYADSLEDIPTTPTRLQLSSMGGQANSVFHSGSMSESPAPGSEPDRYVYDPLDTRPGELERSPGPDYLIDQTAVLNTFGNGLIYHSEPFEEDTEITGVMRLSAWIEMDVPDTDFHATVYEVLADGSSIQLTDAYLRARYRESPRDPRPVPVGEAVRYDFDDFMFISRLAKKGSRLRLFLRSPNSIQLQKNYNSGGTVADETGADARTAHISLIHDPDHPSYLEVPIVRRSVFPQ